LLTAFLVFSSAVNRRRSDEPPSAANTAPAVRETDRQETSQLSDENRDVAPPQASWATDTVFTDVRTASTPETVLVRGAFVLVDAQGSEHLHEDGRFELSVWGPVVPQGNPADPGRRRLRRQQVTQVEVHQGRWQAQLPGHTSRRIAQGRLRGLPLFDLQVEELESDDPEVSELRVTGRALYPARISVVDSETQRDLDGVSIAVTEPDDPRSHPGNLVPETVGAVSPFEIPAPAVDRRVYLVGAVDHAWQRVEWNHLSDAPRTIELQRSGGLAIDVEADCRLEDCAVTITAPGADTPQARFATDSSPLEIHGLAPGDYRIALVPRAGLVATQAASLDEAQGTVVAGEITVVALQGKLGERPDAVDLACRIRMSSSWSAGGPHVLVRALGRTALWHLDTGGVLGAVSIEQHGGDWMLSSAVAVAGGRYLFTERLTGFVREIEVGPATTPEVLLEIPDPIRVRVEVVDRETQAPIPSSELVWLPPTPANMPRPSSSRPWIETTDRAGVFLARVPAWELLEFEAQAPGYESAPGRLRPEPSAAASLRITLERR